MTPNEVMNLYDPDYARAYDERFLQGDYNATCTQFERDLIGDQLTPDARWLDVGCGTGFLLAQFPGAARAGLDLSPAMVATARDRNPDAMFIEQGDFRQPRAEWRSAWTLVSCMWAPYSYVETIAEVEQLVSNIAAWTAPGGTALIPVIELLGEQIPFRYDVEQHHGDVTINGLIWSWDDVTGRKRHERMILPHIGQVVEWLAPHFERVRVLRYPRDPHSKRIGARGDRLILATGRRDEAQTADSKARVIWEAAPAGEVPAKPLASVRTTELLHELRRRADPLRRIRRWWRS